MNFVKKKNYIMLSQNGHNDHNGRLLVKESVNDVMSSNVLREDASFTVAIYTVTAFDVT